MSDDLYPTRVFFNGYSGCIKTPGIYRHITMPPEIPGLPEITSIDYAPGAFHLVLPYMGELRELFEAEVAAINAWLKAVREGAK